MTDIQSSVNKQSDDPAELKREQLRQLLPEAFSEDKLDITALKRALGESATVEAGERYRLDWVGKTEAYQTLQATTTSTLRPMREQSVNFDSANHVFIEGENLETLKVIQKAYFGQVKLIYIDPPYNTGNDNFVYPDRFQESKEDYLRRINELDEQGALLREGQFRKNSRESGHYHSNWLSMMLPRLYIARNLLKDDGVIFVSCDDNEVYNLRCLMNEIFGEENFVAAVIWHKMDSPKNSARHFSDDHDYIVVYAKNAEVWRPNLIPRSEKMLSRYKNPDNDPRGPWLLGDLAARNPYAAGIYPITTPKGRVIDGPPAGSYWRVSKEKFRELEKDGRIWWGENQDNRPGIKRFLNEVKEGVIPQTYWSWKDVGSTRHSKRQLSEALDAKSGDLLFDTPKPIKLIQRILQIGTDGISEDVVMDFFAGSGSTMDAVLQQNVEDDGNRRCILVQMAEPLNADNAEFSDIAQVARTRVRKALEKLHSADDLLNKLPAGEGFRAYRLAASCFPQWRPQSFDNAEELAEQIRLFMDADNSESNHEAIAQELLLKSGYPLTTAITAQTIADVSVYSVDDGNLILILEAFNADMIEPLMAMQPDRIIVLDAVFNDSDQLKANLALQCRDAETALYCM